jgi:signal transduction histidine kinase
MIELRSRAYRSVFAKLVTVMFGMAASILLLVTGFFWLIGDAGRYESIDALETAYATRLATSHLDQAAAREISERLPVQIRYEGPDASWSTSMRLPSIEDARKSGRRHALSRNYNIVSASNGGTYLFVWTYGPRVHSAHSSLLAVLLTLLLGTVVATYLIQKNLLLRPLKALHEGVALLGEGNLDVELPISTRDEFGALTDAFNKMVRRVGELVRARNQLLQDVSHELRSPLTRLKVALELVPESDHKERMAEDVTEMEWMITELLELERLRDARGISVIRQDLVHIIRQEIEALAGRPPGINFVACPPSIELALDGDKIRLVIRNLLENALKYSLSTSRPVEVRVEECRDGPTVTCTDDGPGIPEEDMGSIFEPFYRVDRSRSKATGGYGLGLSICKRIMEAHGASITVKNNPSRGVSFRLQFGK